MLSVSLNIFLSFGMVFKHDNAAIKLIVNRYLASCVKELAYNLVRSVIEYFYIS